METLDQMYGIKGHVTVGPGRNGLPMVELSTDPEHTAEIYLNGAHITSWRSAGQELLFLSANAVFEERKAIRGGIPLVFPQFGAGALPQHGFARNSKWQLESTSILQDGRASAIFALGENEDRLKLWPHKFSAKYTVAVGTSLETSLLVKNNDQSTFHFTTALHTYFGVGDIQRTSVEGLQNVEYSDSLSKGRMVSSSQNAVRFEQEVDRRYLATPGTLFITDEHNHRCVRIEKSGFVDAVVWNPWIEKARRMEDFGDKEYLTMVCVEAGCVYNPIQLKEAQTWEGKQTLSVQS